MGHDKIEKTVKTLARRVGKVENEVSGIGDDLHGLLQVIEETGKAQNAEPSSCGPKREGNWRDELTPEGHAALRDRAKTGVTNINIEPLSKGRARVTIDGGAEMELTPVLAGLMRALCEDSGFSDDGLVGFKTLADLTWLLGKNAKKHVKPHAVSAAVSRLRDALAAKGYNPYLVQTDHRLGYRFAKRRADDDVIVARCV